MTESDSQAIENPTWYGNIRGMFTPTDIKHMGTHGLDLTSYDDVRAAAGGIYGQVATGNMPKDDPWSKAWVQTFLNWMTNKYPKGAPAYPKAEAGLEAVAASQASRIRKDITEVAKDSAELSLLQRAFRELKKRDPSDKNSYFVQAGYHWYPAPTYCQHHAPAYNPWHRAFLMSFEDALRSVPGCEDLTLPYWDITKPFPDVLKQDPFDSYTLPENIGGGFNKGYVTQRFHYPDIAKNLVKYNVTNDLNLALKKADWEDFHGYWADAPYTTIIAAHDGGHGSIGTTMANPAVAAFDPVFWFFHANWDRLFWEWQKRVQATDLNGLLSTINKTTDLLSYQIFTLDPLKTLEPFTSMPRKLDTVKIIDSVGSLDVDYAPAPGAAVPAFESKSLRRAFAFESIQVDTERAHVRIKDLNRLRVPGSFSVHLKRDGETIASKFLFQPPEPEKCESCVENAIAHFDFELPLSEVSSGKLTAVVEPLDKSVIGNEFPHKLMGNPTVEVRLMMKTED